MATPRRTRPAPSANPVAPEVDAVIVSARRRYRALRDFEVAIGDARLVFHAGRTFATDSIPFDPLTMEPM